MVKRDNRDPKTVGVPLKEVKTILAEQEQKFHYQVFFLLLLLLLLFWDCYYCFLGGVC